MTLGNREISSSPPSSCPICGMSVGGGALVYGGKGEKRAGREKKKK